jgi:hypothetical protein
VVRDRRLLGWLAIAGAAAAAAGFAPGEPSPAPEAAAPPVASPVRQPAPGGRLAALPAREALGKGRGDLFGARSWAPAPAVRRAPASVTRAPVAPPAPPPMPYRVAGEVQHGESAHVVLAKGDEVLLVREGESLEGGYRVEAIAVDRVTLLYEPLGVRQNLPLASALDLAAQPAAQSAAQSAPAAEGRPAQARWEGPERVRKGDTFEVALKVTSAQSLDALPLQLAFDAKVLELVAVRSGGFFGAKGKFSYRVSPEGYVSVGASGPGRVASDAELVVFTFKPIRPAIAAELKLSSLVLQGSAYRTAIMP